MSSNKRSNESQGYRRLYKLKRWKDLREAHLSESPLCVYCIESGEVAAADVVDHIKPHKGDERLFWDRNNLQSLCAQCHDRLKQREELGQFVIRFGPDGYPL